MCALAPRSACTIRRTISGARAVARAVGAGVLALVATVGGARRVQAQAPLSVRGSVVRQTLDGTRVVSRELVTLHRVNSREAGPIDSMTTDAKGTFAFRVASPDSLSMYLASARYGGIAYFSQPMQAGQVAGGPSEIVVYDTTSADVRLQLQGRHLVVSSPNADGVRSVIDVLEIENDTVVTRVAGAANRATYSLLLPDGARNVRASQGEMSDGAVEVRDGRADVYAPLSPGLRQLVLTYELPASVFPVSVPLERDVSVLEVLLEEPGATAEGGGLKSQGGVTVDGKTFTRYLGQGAPATAVVTLGVAKGIGGTSVPTWVLPLVLSLVTLGVILVVARRAPSRAPSRVPSPAHEASRPTAAAVAPSRSTERTPAPGTHGSTAWAVAPVSDEGGQGETLPVEVVQLARHVAAVDALLARDPDQRAELRAELQGYRAARKAELVDALARRTRVR
jgi:hypothetical protein